VRADLGNFADAKWFGAKGNATVNGTGGSDDTPAVQAGIDTLYSLYLGGQLFFSGQFKCAEPLNLDGKTNIQLTGPAGTGAGGNKPPPSQIIYTGVGARFIDARSSYAITLRDIGIRYTSAAFGGRLIDFSHDAALDAAYGLLERCYVGGYAASASPTATLVSLNLAIICCMVDSNFQHAAVGVKGGEGGYSNSHTVERCTFSNLTTSGVMNAIQMWTVKNCTFESGPRAYWDDQNVGAVTNCLTWKDNWHGDGVFVADTWFSYGTTVMRTLTVSGNYFDTTFTNVPGMKLSGACESGFIVANTFSGGSNSGIDFGGIAQFGILVVANYYNADPINIHASSNDLWIFANKLNGGFAKTIIRVAHPEEMQLGNAGGTGIMAALQGIGSLGSGTTTPEMKFGADALAAFDGVPSPKPVVSGSCAGNIAVQNLVAAFAALGLITNTTTP
jgi:hypothetical protein